MCTWLPVTPHPPVWVSPAYHQSPRPSAMRFSQRPEKEFASCLLESSSRELVLRPLENIASLCNRSVTVAAQIRAARVRSREKIDLLHFRGGLKLSPAPPRSRVGLPAAKSCWRI